MDIASKKIAISEYLNRLCNTSRNYSIDYINSRLDSYKDSVFEEIKYDAYEDLMENKNFDLHKRKKILEELEIKMNSVKFEFKAEHTEDSCNKLKELESIIEKLRGELTELNQFGSGGSIFEELINLAITVNDGSENVPRQKNYHNSNRGESEKYKINVNRELKSLYKILKGIPVEFAEDINKQVKKLIELYNAERYDRCIEILDKRLKKAIDETEKRLIKNEEMRNVEVIMNQYEQYLCSILDMCENFFEDLPKGEEE